MRSPTRQRLTEAAVRRFYRDGFRNVGLDQVLADVGISKTAFYKHFECKEDLVLAALEMQNRWLQDTFREMVRLDYQYVAGWTLARDIEILAATLPAVLSGRGAW